MPCYNEEEVLHETTKRLIDKLNRMTADGLISPDSRILYVDDGSKDKTWRIIEELHGQEPRVLGVKTVTKPGPPERAPCGVDDGKGHVRRNGLDGCGSAG